MPTILLRWEAKGFQSTPPCEGATWQFSCVQPHHIVSIHAPVRGGDILIIPITPLTISFNPRPRARGRLGRRDYNHYCKQFQSTPPCEGATQR